MKIVLILHGAESNREVGEKLSRASSVLVFGLLDTGLGHGIVGGSLVSFEHTGTRATELALGSLKGDLAAETTPPSN